ncbi:hypothetical protein BX666DRAFT_2029239 [Dichotomocladium elegans]|nr:hypothetical protein BX666DRAFT_2029239 [Dichotomocladium elegans]
MAEDKLNFIKTSLRSVGWKQEYEETLDNLVQTTHFLTTHTSKLSRYRKYLRDGIKNHYDDEDIVCEIEAWPTQALLITTFPAFLSIFAITQVAKFGSVWSP